MKPGTVHKIIQPPAPEVSIIIPTMRDASALNPLLDDIAVQTVKSVEVIMVYRVAPSGKARNLGMEAAKCDYLIFFDDDIRLGDKNLLANLRDTLKSSDKIGLAGASIRIPPDANRFQRRVAREIPRMVCPIVDEITDSDMVTTQCWAQKRTLFDRIGPFNEVLPRGVDPEYRRRVRQSRYRIVLAPRTWTYHPPPPHLKSFLKQNFRNGYSSALAQKLHPKLVAPVPDSGQEADLREISFSGRVCRSLNLVVKSLFRFKTLLLWERISYGAGYLYGRIRG